MKKLKVECTLNLLPDQVKDMHRKALECIEKIGLDVPHQGMLRILSDYKGVIIEGTRVKLKDWLVEKSIKNMSCQMGNVPDGYKIVGGCYPLNVVDLDTGRIRPATRKDLVCYTKLCDSYNVIGSACVRPTDLPPRLQEVAMYKLTWENSPIRGDNIYEVNPKSSLEVAEYVYRMAQSADKFFSLGMWIQSPFKTDPQELDIIFHFLDRGVALWCANMPLAGATAPIFPLSAWIQSIAEILAGYTILRLISPDSYVYCCTYDNIRAYVFNMKDGNTYYSSPQDILGTFIHAQINRYYGMPVLAHSLNTNAQMPDAHAASEKASHTIMAACIGVDGFIHAGNLATDDIFSAQQLVIDNEIVRYAVQFSQGIDYDKNTQDIEKLKDVVMKNRTFLDHPTTVNNYRNLLWDSELFEDTRFRQWQYKGGKSVLSKARDIANERINRHEFCLEQSVQRELDKIYREAIKALG